MNKKYILYIYFLSLLSGNIISHEELDSSPYGLPIHIKAFLDLSELEFHNFLLLYRPLGNMEYIETPMLKIGNSDYEGIIPGEFCKREYIEYYLLLEMPK